MRSTLRALTRSDALRALLGVTGGLALWRTARADAPAIPLNVGLIDKTFYVLPLWIAMREGIAAREGLDIRLSYVPAGESAASRLLNGTVDVQLASPDTVIQNASRGGPLRIVAGNANKLSHSLIARAPFKQISDLKGATIGILTMTEGSFFNIQDMLEPHGLSYPRDYKVVTTAGAGARHKLLLDGTIDAGLQSIPWSYLAVDAGMNDLGEAIAYIPDWLFTVWLVNQSMTANRAAIAPFLRTLRAGTERMYADRDLSVAVLVDELRMPAAYAQRGWEYFTSNAVFPKDLSVTKAGFARVFADDDKAKLLPAGASADLSGYVASFQ